MIENILLYCRLIGLLHYCFFFFMLLCMFFSLPVFLHFFILAFIRLPIPLRWSLSLLLRSFCLATSVSHVFNPSPLFFLPSFAPFLPSFVFLFPSLSSLLPTKPVLPIQSRFIITLVPFLPPYTTCPSVSRLHGRRPRAPTNTGFLYGSGLSRGCGWEGGVEG